MNSFIALSVFIVYTILLFMVSFFASRKSNNDTFFRGNRKSPWFVVAYGMIGASLSGVTFMSVPGYVQSTQFTYFGVVLGYLVGYAIVALVLLPLYYRLNLTSIYTYLDRRFGSSSRKTGAFFFIVSRILGSALRMYLAVFVLYEFIFKSWGVPFWVPALVFVMLILAYTLKGGIKTVVWTDTVQTTFMLLATVVTVIYILKELDMSLFTLLKDASKAGYTKMIETDWRSNNCIWKQIASGAFITIAMTGLDQDMMQKNLTCKSLKDAQKNVFSLSISILIVNLLFLSLGVALLYYAQFTGFALPEKSDSIFPSIAFNLSTFTAVAFMIGLVAAAYSSADGTLTSLTTTFCYDFLLFDDNKKLSDARKTGLRKLVHIGFAALYLLIIIAFKPFHTDSLIKMIFNIASYTYGPLLGLYSFGLFVKKRTPRGVFVPFIAILSPVICYFLNRYSVELFNGYHFGFELLILNGLLTFVALLAVSKKHSTIEAI
jgi:Na+/proline symporter